MKDILDPEVRSYIQQLEHELSQTRERYESLKEQLALVLYRRFSRSSEQGQPGQAQLFEEAESTAAESAEHDSDSDEGETESITVPAHTRRKRGRKPIDANLPRVDIVHEIDEADRQCACGAVMDEIGSEVSERVQVIPEQIYVERHIRPKRACRSCEGAGDEDRPAVRVKPAPPSMIPGSIVTAGLLAFVIVNKFVDHLPLYRQAKRFERLGVHISRQDMSNWIVAVGKRIFPLIELMRERIRAGPLIQMDETTLQVLREPGRENAAKSHMWLTRGGAPQAPLYLYEYSPSRGSECPRAMVENYEGYLQSDGYRVYEQLSAEFPRIVQVGCWAHARRKFFEAAKASTKSGAAHEGLKHINSLYRIERELREQQLEEAEFVRQRRERVEPHLERFKTWLTKKGKDVVGSSLLGKAVHYTLARWQMLVRYLDLAALTPDNNAVENAIRPFVVGRKNWLFSGSPAGARASCALYSLIQTARANGLNPYAYLHYVFTRVPTITCAAQWHELLPHNLDPDQLNAAFLSRVG